MTARLSFVPVDPVHTVTRRRIEQTINGRTYQIDVAPVGVDRWRAQIVRQHGGPSALMPFYGTTADEAAALLSHWLLQAHRTASPTP
jgi:hypothetical protein